MLPFLLNIARIKGVPKSGGRSSDEQAERLSNHGSISITNQLQRASPQILSDDCHSLSHDETACSFSSSTCCRSHAQHQDQTLTYFGRQQVHSGRSNNKDAITFKSEYVDKLTLDELLQ